MTTEEKFQAISAVLFAIVSISETLGLSKRIKQNSIAEIVFDGIKFLAEKLKKKQ